MLDEWMNECMMHLLINGNLYEQMDGWIKLTSRWLFGGLTDCLWVTEWTENQSSDYIYEWMNEWMVEFECVVAVSDVVVNLVLIWM